MSEVERLRGLLEQACAFIDRNCVNSDGLEMIGRFRAALAEPQGEQICLDWTEDFNHENGNYSCRCCQCGEQFAGHKRRVVCKLCDGKGEPAPAQTEQQQPIGYVNPRMIERMKAGEIGGTSLTPNCEVEERHTMPVFAAPIAQTAPQPEQSGLVGEMEYVITQVLNDLPSKRDWLDPALEARMKALSAQRGDA